jgi:hypothetical protein
MTTLNEMIAIIKAENPTLQHGNDEQGYTQLSKTDYEAQIAQWADGRLAKEAKLAEAEQAATDKAALLAKLGISAEEAKLLLQ